MGVEQTEKQNTSATSLHTTLAGKSLRLMVALCRSPWATARQLSDEAELALVDVVTECEALQRGGHITQAAIQNGPKLHNLYAPSLVGLAQIAAHLWLDTAAIAARTIRSSSRFWAMRGAQEAVRAAYLFCAQLRRSRSSVSERVSWDLFVPRQYKGTELFLHARINIRACESDSHVAPCASYLLIDSGEHSVWVWWRHLRYLQEWSRQADERFPPLLFISPLTQRALSFATLARQLAPAVPVFVSGDRATALNHGPEQARWFSVTTSAQPNQLPQAETCNPFDSTYHVAGKQIGPKHRVTGIDALLARKGARTSSQKKLAQQPTQDATPFWIQTPPTWLWGIEHMDTLLPEARTVLAFLCHHSACPLSALNTFLAGHIAPNTMGTTNLADAPNRISNVLHSLIDLALAERVGEGDHFSATEVGARLHFLRQGAPSVDRLVSRYRNGHADHARRLAHTGAIFDFFERLHHHAAAWGRVTRKLDVEDFGYNDGDLGYYELEEFDEDVACSAVFMTHDVKRHWMPDAYGVLRQGRERQPFWLEVDGSSAGRAHNEVERWEAKLGAMCAYYATDKWRLRHQTYPTLLVVTTNLRILRVVRDAYDQARTTHQAPELPVYLTSELAVSEQGPLAPIWHKVHEMGDGTRCCAFAPLVRTTT